MEFSWDRRKAQRNLRKHGITFEEAVTIFADPFEIGIYDPDHSVLEDRVCERRLLFELADSWWWDTPNARVRFVSPPRGRATRMHIFDVHRMSRIRLKSWMFIVSGRERGVAHGARPLVMFKLTLSVSSASGGPRRPRRQPPAASRRRRAAAGGWSSSSEAPWQRWAWPRPRSCRRATSPSRRHRLTSRR